MKITIHNIYIVVFIALMCASCSNTKHLPAGDSLFIGGKIIIKDKEATSKEKKAIVEDLEGAVRPKVNSQFLGMRIKLRLYNFAGQPKKTKGFKVWLRNKIGEPPVLASSLNIKSNQVIMENLLQNKGFFTARVRGKAVTSKKRKTTAVFTVRTGPQYRIRQTVFLNDSSSTLDTAIAHDFKRTLLKPGQPYNIDLIKAERTRIDQYLKNRGYYYFTEDYILVQVDTNIGNNELNMYVKLKDDQMPADAYQIQYINDIYVYPGYKLSNVKDKDTNRHNAIQYENVHVVDLKNTYKPYIFADAIRFKPGKMYKLSTQNKSLSRLVNMGLFKFVKNRLEPVGDSQLNVYYYLTPYPKKSLQFQIGALTQNDNRAGSQASIGWKNRNTFRGGEEFGVKVNGGFEAQYGGSLTSPNIYTAGAEATLSFPRFLVPFVNIHTPSLFLPRSIITAKYSYESQSDLLRISSYTASFGYSWKEGVRKEHQFNPINITYVKTDTLGDASKLGLLYGNLIFDGIIIGPTYQFTYSSQVGPAKRNSIYFIGNVDLAGNVLGLAQNANYQDNPKKILGSTYAQYIKIAPDFRHYLRIDDQGKTVLASRIMMGLGIPYGNSQQLPNIKQFWAGGNSDLRGFPSRLAGPGTFNEMSLYGTNQYIQTLGDIKMEFNTEIRQNLYKFLNAAIFFDAGNIWLYRANPQFPGGQFTSSFYKQYAADVGFGLRFDFTILILRLDLGMPVRKPWLADGQRWVFNQIDFGDPSWRKQNLLLNIGIGYPF